MGEASAFSNAEKVFDAILKHQISPAQPTVIGIQEFPEGTRGTALSDALAARGLQAISSPDPDNTSAFALSSHFPSDNFFDFQEFEVTQSEIRVVVRCDPVSSNKKLCLRLEDS